MEKFFLFLALLAFAFLSGCNNGDHFISDRDYRHKVEIQFEKQKKLAVNRKDQLFKVFDQHLSKREKEALEFLYAYMPLCDLADYDGDFYLKNVRASFAAKDTFSWGKIVPESLFRHFVLPIRVNNENLDSSRWIFFSELKDRIKHLSMKDAALEVNHWCHEKVTYKGSDVRTSAPLATVKNAYGRCGEESTFTVAALRAAGIPARQCYTPRWAHSDDNHAWVEVWLDGKWHYMGACEPESDLDIAWFTGPAKRAMLVNTNVFGDYKGPEDVLVKDQRYTRINILSNYAAPKRFWVKVTTQKNAPVDSAIVEYQLYNYAEFYPLQRWFTGKDGMCSFSTGYGDLLVWAAKGNTFGYHKVTVENTDTVTIILNHKPGETYSEVYDFIPPPEKKVENYINDSSRIRNTKRLAFEDLIRADYENTFIDSAKSFRLAANLGVNADSLWQVLHKSRGNWRNLIEFISSVPDDKKNWIFSLLNNISEKDLHDVHVDVLDDNILYSLIYQPLTKDKAIFSSYILSPRIDNEYLKPFKDLFQQKFDNAFILKGRKDPETIVKWVKGSISIDENANYSRTPLTPRGLYELKVADPHSRDIFFVAVCRSFGIPARLETSTRIPQYFFNDKWHDVYFTNPPSTIDSRGKLVINNDPGNDRKPEYYTHFTIEKFEDGFFRSLDYETDPVLHVFPCTIEVPAGSYLLVTGNRISGGTVLTNLSFFNLEDNKTRNIVIELRKDLVTPPVLGRIGNIEGFCKMITGKDETLNKKGNILAWLDPEKEPSRHFIADLLQNKKVLDKWNGSILLLFRTEKDKDLFMKKNATGLPLKTKTAVSASESLENFLKIIQKKTVSDLPVVTFIDPVDEVLYFSEGYKIGIVDEMLRYLHSENKH
jgi:transglutaminase-like putative cysteine protease